MSGAALRPLLITLFVQVMVSFAATAPLAISVLIADEVGFSHDRIGLYSTLLYVSAIGGTLASSKAMARFSVRALLVGGLIFNGMGLLLFTALGVSGGALGVGIAGIIMLGFAYGLVVPASAMVLSDGYSARAQPLIVSIKQTGVPLGTAASAAVLPVLALRLDWQAALITAAAALAVAAGLLALLPRTRGAGPATPSGVARQTSTLALLLGDPPARALAITGFCLGANQVALIALLIPTLVAVHGFDLPAAAGLLAAATLAGAVSRIISGLSVARFGHARGHIAVLGLLGAAAWLALLSPAVASHPLALLLAAILLGATGMGWNGILLAELTMSAPPGQAAAYTGLGVALAYGGVVVGPLIHAGVLQATGSPSAAILSLAGLAAVGSVMLFVRSHKGLDRNMCQD